MSVDDPLLSALAKACRENPTRRKVLLLGNPAHGAATLERLTRSGFNWANLVVHSPVGYANELCAGAMDAAPIPAGAGPAVAAMLLSEEISETSRLRAVGSSQGAAAALWRTITDLRLAGLYSKDLEAKHFLTPLRFKEVQELLRVYEKFLAARGWCDDADILRAGAAAVKKTPDLVLAPTPARWSCLEEAFIKAAGAAVYEVALCREGGLSAMPASVEAFRAVSQEAEAREIARRILAGKGPLDDIEIALAGPEYDCAVLAELFAKLGIPFTVAQGFSLGTLKPGQALLGYLDWVEGGFAAGDLERLLRSGVATLKRADKDIGGLTAARALARFSLYKGRASYEKVFSARAAELEEQAKDCEREGETEKAAWARERLAGFEPLRRALGEIVAGAAWGDSEDKVLLSEAVKGCADFLHGYASVQGELDRGALNTLREALAVPVLAGDRRLSRVETCRLLRETALAVSLGAERGRPGKVHITTLSAAGWEGRRQSFVAGLTLHNHPGKVFQDPFLLDEERKSLGRGLATAEELRAENARNIAGRLASLEGAAVFCAYAFDGHEGRDAGPAALFLQVVRKARKAPEAGYKDIDKLIGDPVGLPPGSGGLAMDELSWWLAADSGRKEREKVFPWTKDAQAAAEGRQAAELGVYDGLVPAAAGALDPTRDGEAVSATYMSDLAACPFRFFLKRVLGIVAKEEEERDPLIWLDARERGELLHDVYADFLRGLGGKRPDPGRDEKPLLKLLDGKLVDWRSLIPPATDALFITEQEELHSDALLFLRKTAEEWPGRKPKGCEVSFGLPGAGDEEELSRPEPVPVSFGGEDFRIRGRVDRIDEIAPGEYEVVDYKTGRFSQSTRERMSALPAAFQPAFYSKAVEALLRSKDKKAKVKAFSFLFSTRAGRWTLLKMGPECVAAVERSIPGLLKILKEGSFKQTANNHECEYCSFAAACGDEPWVRAKELAPEKQS